MKTLLIAFLLFLPHGAMPAENSRPVALKRNVNCDIAYWRPESNVKVYFIREMFTAEQRQSLLSALSTWEGLASKEGLAVSFNDAGETSGLIDCQSCLTVAREKRYQNDRKGRVSLNVMRRTDMGHLSSAWIGIDGSTRDPATLRGLMLEALRNGRGIKAGSPCDR